MWKQLLESFAARLPVQLDDARALRIGWRGLLAETGLLLGLALASSWLARG